MQDPVRQSTLPDRCLEPGEPMLDPLRQSMLSRMGIPSWQLRRPALLEGLPAPDACTAVTPSDAVFPDEPVSPGLAPTGKLWLLAPALPAPALLADICQWLGFDCDQVSQLTSLPEGATPPLLWLTAPDPRWPDALICPLAPDGAQKRALWQQLRQRLASTSN